MFKEENEDDTLKIMGMAEMLSCFKDHNPVLVGSRALGVATPDSDWDFVCTEDTYDTITMNPFRFKDYEEIDNGSEGYEKHLLGNIHNVKFKILNGETVNLLVYEDVEEVKLVADIAEKMKRYPKIQLQSKEFRCDKFEQLCENVGLSGKADCNLTLDADDLMFEEF